MPATPSAPRSLEEKLRACEERLNSIVQHTPNVSIQGYAPDGRILFWNKSSERVFGWRAEEAIGKRLEDLIFTKEEGAAFASMLRDIRQKKQAVGPIEFRFDRRNGQEGWCLSTIFEIPGDCEPNFICMDVDITERKTAEKALRASEELFSKAFSACPDVMSVSDLETGRYLEVNEVHERLFGYARHEVIGRSPEELGLLANPTDHGTFVHELRAHGRVRDYEVIARNRHGKQMIVLISAELVHLSGRVCVLRITKDITERKAAEECLRKAQADALLARQEFTQRLISAQEQERKRLASDLHDSLGQDLSLIKNRVHLALTKHDLPPAVVSHLEAVAKLADDTLNEVRNLSHHLRPLPIEEFGLTDSLENLVQEVAASSTIRFESRFEQIDDLFPGEQATMVYRIVQEALSNLVKHACATSATVTVERDLRCARLRIEDNGRGFHRSSVVGPRTVRTGIGLTSIEERVTMLGGNLDIRSGPGQGTVLEIEIPLSEAAGVLPAPKLAAL